VLAVLVNKQMDQAVNLVILLQQVVVLELVKMALVLEIMVDRAVVVDLVSVLIKVADLA
jgi:hypothetical protein